MGLSLQEPDLESACVLRNRFKWREVCKKLGFGVLSLRLSLLWGSTPWDLGTVEAVLSGSWGAVGTVLPGKTGAYHAAALRARGPVALAEPSRSLPSYLAKVQDNQLLPDLRHLA